MKRASSLLATLTLTGAGLALASCFSGFNSKTPAIQIYVLRPKLTIEPVAGAPSQGSLKVLLPEASAGLSSDGIAVVHAGTRLDYYRGARWGASAPAMLQTLAIDALRATHRFALVEPEVGPFPSDYVLSLELREFEADYVDSGAPIVHVLLIGTYGQRGEHDVTMSFTAAGQARAVEDRMQAVVAAFEQATDAALTQMAASLASTAAAHK